MAAALQIDSTLIDASATLGASSFRTFFRVVSLSIEGIIAGTILTCHTLGEFGVVLMVGGNFRGSCAPCRSRSTTTCRDAHRGGQHHRPGPALFSFAVLSCVYALMRKLRVAARPYDTSHASVQKRYGADFHLNVTVSLAPGITMLFGASGSGTRRPPIDFGADDADAGSIAIGQRVLFASSLHVNVSADHRNRLRVPAAALFRLLDR